MKEVWKDIEKYEKYYMVSNLGRIKRKERFTYNKKRNINYHLKEMIVHPSDNGHGYLMIRLYPDYKPYYIHRLVAQAFIINLNKSPQVNHIDGNKKNNSVNNLEWVTPSENQVHSYSVLKTKYNLTGLKKSIEKQKKKVLMIDNNNNILKKYDSISEASRENKISPSVICGCCKGIYKTGKGYYWKYANEKARQRN